MTFGERLKAARERAGLTAYALGVRTGVSAETVRRIERGQCDPQLSTAMALAAGVGEYLVELTGPLPVLPDYVPKKAGRKRKDQEAK